MNTLQFINLITRRKAAVGKVKSIEEAIYGISNKLCTYLCCALFSDICIISSKWSDMIYAQACFTYGCPSTSEITLKDTGNIIGYHITKTQPSANTT